MLFSQIKEVPDFDLTEAGMWMRAWDLRIWCGVCDIYEKKIDAATKELDRLPPDQKQRKKALNRLYMRTHHGLSGRALSDDPYRFEWRPYRSVLAVAQELRAAALEQDLLALSNAAKEMMDAE